MKLRENEFSVQLKKKKIFKNFEMLRLFIEIKILTKQNFNENQIRQRTFLYIYSSIYIGNNPHNMIGIIIKFSV